MTEKMFFRCTKEERAEIEACAQAVGLERSSYLRAQSLNNPKRRAIRQIRTDWEKLQSALGKINQAGNVINQLLVYLRKISGDTSATQNALLKWQDNVASTTNELRLAARAVVITLREGK